MQSGHGLRCCGNITRTRNVSEYMLVLALCLVAVVICQCRNDTYPLRIGLGTRRAVMGVLSALGVGFEASALQMFVIGAFLCILLLIIVICHKSCSQYFYRAMHFSAKRGIAMVIPSVCLLHL